MTQTPDEQYDDQDAGPATQPTGAAAEDSPTEDQDAGPATVPDDEAGQDGTGA